MLYVEWMQQLIVRRQHVKAFSRECRVFDFFFTRELGVEILCINFFSLCMTIIIIIIIIIIQRSIKPGYYSHALLKNVELSLL
jgi:hypothetical protein